MITYNPLGKTGKQISRISFGAMRLPKSGDNVDIEKSAEVIRRACELGINYFDTAPYYCNSQSEAAVGKALKGVRENVMIATKLPWEHIESGKEVRGWIEKSLRELETDYIDVYQLWSLKKDGLINFCLEKGVISELCKAKDEGLVKHIGFSYHSEAENIMDILNATDVFDSMLVLSNVFDKSREEQIRLASQTGIGIINMGALCTCGSKEDDFREKAQKCGLTPYETALKYVLETSAFCSVLSSFNSIERVENTVKFINQPHTLSETERALIDDTKLIK